MGSRQLLHIVDLAVRRAPPMIGMPIPARDTSLSRSDLRRLRDLHFLRVRSSQEMIAIGDDQKSRCRNRPS